MSNSTVLVAAVFSDRAIFGSAAAADYPEATKITKVMYNLTTLPYDKLPHTKTGAVDYDKLSYADRDFVRLLWDKASYNITHRAWLFWQCGLKVLAETAD